MPLALATEMTSTIATILTLAALPLWLYLPSGMRLADQIAFTVNRMSRGKSFAQRNLYHPLHRYDLLQVASDGTVLAAHGVNPRRPGTPLLRWYDEHWHLTLAGTDYPLLRAYWQDLAQIDRLTEMLPQQIECQALAALAVPQIAAKRALAAVPTHTLSQAVKDLQNAVQGRSETAEGIAQLVRHKPSGRAVGVLLTLPESLRGSQPTVISAMAAKGWNAVPLDDDPNTICLTKATPKTWETLARGVINPKGCTTGHRLW